MSRRALTVARNCQLSSMRNRNIRCICAIYITAYKGCFFRLLALIVRNELTVVLEEFFEKKWNENSANSYFSFNGTTLEFFQDRNVSKHVWAKPFGSYIRKQMIFSSYEMVHCWLQKIWEIPKFFFDEFFHFLLISFSTYFDVFHIKLMLKCTGASAI